MSLPTGDFFVAGLGVALPSDVTSELSKRLELLCLFAKVMLLKFRTLKDPCLFFRNLSFLSAIPVPKIRSGFVRGSLYFCLFSNKDEA